MRWMASSTSPPPSSDHVRLRSFMIRMADSSAFQDCSGMNRKAGQRRPVPELPLTTDWAVVDHLVQCDRQGRS